MIAKKLAIAAASAALVLGAFSPAFAWGEDNHGVSIDNDGSVGVVAVNLSNSGLNNVSASHHGEVEDSTLTTGASTSNLTVGTEVNANTVVANCGCDGKISIDNDTNVEVFALNGSNSGLNNVSTGSWGGEVEGTDLTTGASTSNANVQTLVNVNSVTVTGEEN